jgi:ATP-binding cassette subfamily C (CFTR/MRP) protein 1
MMHTILTYLAIWVEIWTEQDSNKGTQQIGLNLGIYFLLVALATLGPVGECW